MNLNMRLQYLYYLSIMLFTTTISWEPFSQLN